MSIAIDVLAVQRVRGVVAGVERAFVRALSGGDGQRPVVVEIADGHARGGEAVVDGDLGVIEVGVLGPADGAAGSRRRVGPTAARAAAARRRAAGAGFDVRAARAADRTARPGRAAGTDLAARTRPWRRHRLVGAGSESARPPA